MTCIDSFPRRRLNESSRISGNLPRHNGAQRCVLGKWLASSGRAVTKERRFTWTIARRTRRMGLSLVLWRSCSGRKASRLLSDQPQIALDDLIRPRIDVRNVILFRGLLRPKLPRTEPVKA